MDKRSRKRARRTGGSQDLRIATIASTVSLRSLLPYRYDRSYHIATISLLRHRFLRSLPPYRYNRSYHIATISLLRLATIAITVSLRSLLRIATIAPTVSLRSLLPYRYDLAPTSSLPTIAPTVSLRSLLPYRYNRSYHIATIAPTLSLRSLLRYRYAVLHGGVIHITCTHMSTPKRLATAALALQAFTACLCRTEAAYVPIHTYATWSAPFAQFRIFPTVIM